MKSLQDFKNMVGSRFDRANSISYLYSFLKDVKENKHAVHTEVQINFYNRSYVVSYSGGKVSKYYGQKVLDQTVLDLIGKVVKEVMKEIKEIYE